MRQSRNQRSKKLYPGIDDLRDSPHDEFNDSRDDGGQGFDQDGDSVKDTLCQSRYQLKGCVQNHRQIFNERLHDLRHHKHHLRNESRHSLGDALDERHNDLHTRIHDLRK